MTRPTSLISALALVATLGACSQDRPEPVSIEPVFLGKYDGPAVEGGGGCPQQSAGASGCLPPQRPGTQPRQPGGGQQGGGPGPGQGGQGQGQGPAGAAAAP